MYQLKLVQEYFSNNNIICYNVETYTAKLYNHTIPNKGRQVIDLHASNFEGLRYKKIDMVNSYDKYKVESLKAKRYALESSNPLHPGKKGSVTTITSPKHSYLQENIIFVTRWYCTLK